MIAMKPGPTIDRLEGMGASKARATELVEEAVDELGGKVSVSTTPLIETQGAEHARSGVGHLRDAQSLVPEGSCAAAEAPLDTLPP